ncbi:MAG: HNH endonuclease [Planctomycetota bacterium]
MPGALDEPTLVLNRGWIPIDVTSVRHALIMVYQEDARVLCPRDFVLHDFRSWAAGEEVTGGLAVQTVRGAIPVPEIVVLQRYSGRPRPPKAFSKRFLYQRDRNTCQYCGDQPGATRLTIDHILPRSRGGRSTWTNCALACERCNGQKGDRLPSEVGMSLLETPREPDWSPLLRVPRQKQRSSWQLFVRSRSSVPVPS